MNATIACTAHVREDGGEPDPCSLAATHKILRADGTVRAHACRMGLRYIFPGETTESIVPGGDVVKLAESTRTLFSDPKPTTATAPVAPAVPASASEQPVAPVATSQPANDLPSAVAVLLRHCLTLRGRRRRDFASAIIAIVREASRA
jgi:hypothetical protein